MSRENVELHRRAIEALNARDIEAFIAYCDPEVEFLSMFAAVVGAVYHGHDGMRGWHRDFEDAWGNAFRIEPEVYFDLGDDTVVFYVAHGRGRHSPRGGRDAGCGGGEVARWPLCPLQGLHAQ